MISSKESGHAKNVSNFSAIIEVVLGYGTKYNPSNSSIQLPSLNSLSSLAKESIDTLYKAVTLQERAVNQRKEVFAPVKPLVTRVVNALAASQVSKHLLEDAQSLKKKLNGTKITGTSSEAAAAKSDAAEEPAPKAHSTSQQSFDSVVENMAKLISLLSAEPAYAPNETDLQLGSLTALLIKLRDANKLVMEAQTSLDNARMTRDKVLYTETTGLSDVAHLVKNYVVSVFGATSMEYKQLSGISIKNHN